MSSWARHYQHVWEERAGDPRLPLWLRVAALAYGRHDSNGHAPFKRGQVALILGRPPDDTGGPHPLDRREVWRAIDRAVMFEWLAEGSNARCLVVPAHAVKKGRLGEREKPCPIHNREASS